MMFALRKNFVFMFGAAVLQLLLPQAANAQTSAGPTCTAPWLVDQTLANGSRWQMCWERRDREGIVLQDIHFTNKAGVTRRVMAEAAVAQIHVPYDDNLARYHDVSDYGLGTPSHMNVLSQGECPGGQLLNDGTSDVVCRQTMVEASEGVLGTATRVESKLVLFSVSHVGAYNYIPQWNFHDDGTIEPAMGATGRLQRFRNDEQYGWPIRSNTTNYVGVSHLHNYYWRLDFDLGDDGTDDIFEEIDIVALPGGEKRQKVVQAFTSEAARKNDPAKFRTWRIRDGSIDNASGTSVSYEIASVDTGHTDEGPASEPWTFSDIYLTKARSCERFASHNPADALGGCSSFGNLDTFVDGESVDGEDQVVWYGLSFHHIPRDEDEPNMHAHWNSFRITPRDWNDAVAAAPAFPPVAPLTPTIIRHDFETNHGWVMRHGPDRRALAGRWEVGRPQATRKQQRLMQPARAAQGVNAMVTGVKSGATADSHDVDAGWTTAYSPVINVPTGSSVQMRFRWLFAHDPTSRPHDFYQIWILSNSGNRLALFERGAPVWRQGAWRTSLLDISEYAGHPIRLHLKASDRGPSTVLEAGFDDLLIVVQP